VAQNLCHVGFLQDICLSSRPHCPFSDRLPQCFVQVIFALPANGESDYQMRIYNSDGSEPEMCGNGIRCLARFVADKDNTAAGSGALEYRVETLAGKAGVTGAILKGQEAGLLVPQEQS
jgi:hypothetical protein